MPRRLFAGSEYTSITTAFCPASDGLLPMMAAAVRPIGSTPAPEPPSSPAGPSEHAPSTSAMGIVARRNVLDM
jgi:hypothetical protein